MDPSLELYRKELVLEAGRKLDKARMIRFEERTGYFASTDLGRTASHFYIKYNTIEVKSLTLWTFKDLQDWIRLSGFCLFLTPDHQQSVFVFPTPSPLSKTFNENFNSQRTEADILSIVSKAEEFEQLKVGGVVLLEQLPVSCLAFVFFHFILASISSKSRNYLVGPLDVSKPDTSTSSIARVFPDNDTGLVIGASLAIGNFTE